MHLKLFLVAILSIGVFTASQVSFTQNPVELSAEPSPSVKGISDINLGIPIPANTLILSENEEAGTKFITLQTTHTPEQVLEFYRIMFENGDTRDFNVKILPEKEITVFMIELKQAN